MFNSYVKLPEGILCPSSTIFSDVVTKKLKIIGHDLVLSVCNYDPLCHPFCCFPCNVFHLSPTRTMISCQEWMYQHGGFYSTGHPKTVNLFRNRKAWRRPNHQQMVIYGDLMRLNGNSMGIYWDITIVVDHGRFITLPKIHIPTLPLSRASEDSYIYIF